jgi:predicted nucleic acid-binding protein
VLEEVYFKILCQASSNYLKKISVKNIKKLLSDSEKRKAVLRPLKEYSQYIEILKISGLKILNVEYEDISMAVEISSEYGLITADAMHLAVMKRTKIDNIATSDKDFGIVPWITVWYPYRLDVEE